MLNRSSWWRRYTEIHKCQRWLRHVNEVSLANVVCLVSIYCKSRVPRGICSKSNTSDMRKFSKNKRPKHMFPNDWSYSNNIWWQLIILLMPNMSIAIFCCLTFGYGFCVPHISIGKQFFYLYQSAINVTAFMRLNMSINIYSKRFATVH